MTNRPDTTNKGAINKQTLFTHMQSNNHVYKASLKTVNEKTQRRGDMTTGHWLAEGGVGCNT